MPDNCFEEIEEKNSRGGRVGACVMDSKYIFRKFLKVSVLYFKSVGMPWDESERLNPAECARTAYLGSWYRS